MAEPSTGRLLATMASDISKGLPQFLALCGGVAVVVLIFSQIKQDSTRLDKRNAERRAFAERLHQRGEQLRPRGSITIRNPNGLQFFGAQIHVEDSLTGIGTDHGTCWLGNATDVTFNWSTAADGTGVIRYQVKSQRGQLPMNVCPNEGAFKADLGQWMMNFAEEDLAAEKRAALLSTSKDAR